MVGENKARSDEDFPNKQGDDMIINVPFPYSADDLTGDDIIISSAPEVEIDYTPKVVPVPKKTLNIRRSGRETRVVQNSKGVDHEAKSAEHSSASGKKSNASDKTDGVSETMEKLVKSVDTISVAAEESHRYFANITRSLEKQSSALPKLDALQKHLDQSHKVETANQRLFDVMHNELKGYKDNFLFDALQKPIIRDLLALFDDLCGQARRLARFLKENPPCDETQAALRIELQASHDNINNTVFFIIEVLNRLDVTILAGDDTALDLKLHKVVGVDVTHDEEEKNRIAKVVRPGFLWKDRVLRPTDVIIKKYSPTPTIVESETAS